MAGTAAVRTGARQPEGNTGGGETLAGLLIAFASAALYFFWKGQAGMWRTAPSAAIFYLGLLLFAIACQQELLRLPWPGLQQGAPAFLAVLVALSSFGYFDFTAGTIGFEAGVALVAISMLYQLKQAGGLRNISTGHALRSLTNLLVLVAGIAYLVSLYLPWEASRSYQVVVNNKLTPLGEVDPRFLAAMHMAYQPRTAFVTTWTVPAAAVALAMVVWALFRRSRRTPAWYAYAPLCGACGLTAWTLLLVNGNLGPYVGGAAVLVLVLGGLMAGIRGQLEAVRYRFRTND